MRLSRESQTESTGASLFTAEDVAAILRDRGWLSIPPSPAVQPEPDAAGRMDTGEGGEPEIHRFAELQRWLREATALLGAQAADRKALEELLALIFRYDARRLLEAPESHAVLAREGAREVVRELGRLVLAGPEMDSNRFKEVVSALKARLRFRGRELFHPVRLALAGRAGEGELDRVILLLDPAARLPFPAPVKGTRQRMLEFCAALE